MEHFRSYLENEMERDYNEYQEDTKTPMVYVKKWMKTKHAIMFRLSNKVV